VRIELELRRGDNGRPEGTVKAHHESEGHTFVGTIQLLRLIELLTETGDVAAGRGDEGGSTS
jgi:hypothetical protein